MHGSRKFCQGVGSSSDKVFAPVCGLVINLFYNFSEGRWESVPQGGSNLILSYISRLGSFFGVKILNFNILGGFQKNEYFFGMKVLWIFGDQHKI